MTGSPLFDLFLAMAVFYFALCMVCSSVNDAVARILQWRAKTLSDCIRSLLLNTAVPKALPTGDKIHVQLVDLLFQHPFIQTLRLQAELGDMWLGRQMDKIGALFMRGWKMLVGSTATLPDDPQLDPQTKLTFIDSSVFVHTLGQIIRPEGADDNEPLTLASLWRSVTQLPEGPLKTVLKSLVNDPSRDLDTVQAKIAKWFEDGMSQATIWYRHKMRSLSLVIGTVMVIGLNIDSVEVVNRFYRDSNLRSFYAATGKQMVDSEANPGKKSSTPQSTVNPVGDLQLGWQTTNPREILAQLTRGMKWAGLILTIVAIGMGAPFWHDVVTRLVSTRDKTGAKSS
jgi:hypothetical protein